jgi:hypothetical protein
MIGNIVKVAVGIFILHFLWTKVLFPSKWLGFYYPDAGNLMKSIQSSQEFKTLDECRNWAEEMADSQGRTDTNWDYECGKGCKLASDYKDLSENHPEMIREYNLTPSYVCDETLD